MRTKEFAQVARKITGANLFYNLKKGEHGQKYLGHLYFGTTEQHYMYIWRKYRTLKNMVVNKTAEETNTILKEHGINEFVAKPTKSGRFCRLHLVK